MLNNQLKKVCMKTNKDKVFAETKTIFACSAINSKEKASSKQKQIL